MSVQLARVPPSKLLRTAGILSLLAALGHEQVAATQLAPRIKSNDLAASTTLTGWHQGSFAYVVYGLNYLRLSGVAPSAFTTLDKLTLATQVLFHAFSILRLPQLPPKVLSGVLIALVGGGLAV